MGLKNGRNGQWHHVRKQIRANGQPSQGCDHRLAHNQDKWGTHSGDGPAWTHAHIQSQKISHCCDGTRVYGLIRNPESFIA